MVTHRAKNAPTNATLTVTYPNATKLEFEPKRLNIVAKYEAQNPEEEGVTTYTSKSKECSRLPISSSILDPLFGFLLCSTTRTIKPIEIEFDVKSSAIKKVQANQFEINVAEYLPGPGRYRLTQITITCPNPICENKKRDWIATFDEGIRVDPFPPVIFIGNDRTRLATVGYSGQTLKIHPSKGSFIEPEPKNIENKAFEFDEIIQDAHGKWFISDETFDDEDRTYRVRPNLQEFSSPVHIDHAFDINNYIKLNWTEKIEEIYFENAYSFIKFYIDGVQNVPKNMWKGRITIKSRNKLSPYTHEERLYYYRLGKVYGRKTTISDEKSNSKMEEWLELDNRQQALFHEKRFSDHIGREQKVETWNRLQFEAFPERWPSQPNADIDLLIQEGSDVLKLIPPQLEAKLMN